MIILLMIIDGYFISGYCWLLMGIIWVVILLMVIGVILLMVIGGY